MLVSFQDVVLSILNQLEGSETDAVKISIYILTVLGLPYLPETVTRNQQTI